ncbi:MAG: CDP-alcohol phosphatidyltransferase family protein [Acidimicrobiales bacterium]
MSADRSADDASRSAGGEATAGVTSRSPFDGIRAADALTWPNLITFARLLCIPLFVWLLFGRENRAAAAWLLAVLGSTDWVDGWIARRFDQATELGALFDPTVDRLLFLVAIPCLLIDGSIPVVVAVIAIAREGLVAIAALILGSLGVPRFPVTWEGKTGRFLLMFAFPMFLGAESTLSYAPILYWLAWLFAIPGLGYSVYSALFQYVPAARRGLEARHGDRGNQVGDG